MGFQLKNKKTISVVGKPKAPLDEQFDFLIKNIAVFKKQQFVNAILNMHSQYKRTKSLSPEQVGYLNYLSQKAQNG